jgi:Flp pilus assembly protein TadD
MSVNSLAILLRDKGDYDGAEVLYRRALEGYEKALGVEHPSTLGTVNNLAVLLNAKSRRTDALEILREKARLSERVKDRVRYNLACYECLEGKVIRFSFWLRFRSSRARYRRGAR